MCYNLRIFSIGRKERLWWVSELHLHFNHFLTDGQMKSTADHINSYYHLDLSSFSQIYRITEKPECILIDLVKYQIMDSGKRDVIWYCNL